MANRRRRFVPPRRSRCISVCCDEAGTLPPRHGHVGHCRAVNPGHRLPARSTITATIGDHHAPRHRRPREYRRLQQGRRKWHGRTSRNQCGTIERAKCASRKRAGSFLGGPPRFLGALRVKPFLPCRTSRNQKATPHLAEPGGRHLQPIGRAACDHRRQEEAGVVAELPGLTTARRPRRKRRRSFAEARATARHHRGTDLVNHIVCYGSLPLATTAQHVPCPARPASSSTYGHHRIVPPAIARQSDPPSQRNFR